jgi:hypothetical protein
LSGNYEATNHSFEGQKSSIFEKLFFSKKRKPLFTDNAMATGVDFQQTAINKLLSASDLDDMTPKGTEN